MKSDLLKKIKSKDAVIGIIGMGYVGLPLALAFSNVNVKTVGFDVDDSKIRYINDGVSYFKHISSDSIRKATQNKLLCATTDFSEIGNVDAIIMCLPTPLNRYREPDLSYIINTMETILPYLRKGQVLSLESTTYPGTTDEELATRITRKGLSIGTDFFLIYSPEREDPGNPDFTTSTIPKVVGGTTEKCLEIGIALYEVIIEKVIPLSSTKAAELTKLLENIYRSVNIGLVNEMKMISDKMDIDIWEVIDAAATKPFGFTPFYPGPGLGGHCIPIDPFYLTWKAKEYSLNTRFIELSGEVNTLMPHWVVQKVSDSLNEHEKPLKNSNVLVLGLAYKKDIDDVRESPSVELMELLREKGANVSYTDPFIPRFPKMREHHFDLKSMDLDEDYLKSIDCVVISTDHSVFDYDFILEYSNLIIDTRGVYRKPNSKVVRA
ncbi:nucleotide sugar dehydrogenase [Paenibacillus lautus]|uniref:nucleotide sugar dehydrogenase n=1 Tax=Paenibacillus lautus TaxID=1401 RepID=UPI0027DEDFC8|nr:nucleotide sugar dehydrogenase [Paenibacillus lautus]